MKPLAFLCLGTMGYPMAGHLARAGHPVTVYNRTRSRAEAWVAEYGGALAPTPAEAVRDAEIVFACSGDDGGLRSIATGDSGAFAGMRRGAVFVDHTTVSAGITRELAGEAERRGLAYLDAPVSGGQSGAENAALTIMLGGDPAVYREILPVLSRYAKKTLLLGPVGSGQIAKMANQICIAGLVQALSEGLDFARKAGLDGRQVVEVISQGAAQSWQMDHRAQTMLAGKFDFGFAVDWMRKDLGIAFEEAQRIGAALPVTRLVDGFYAEIQAAGGGRWDTSSLITRLSGTRAAARPRPSGGGDAVTTDSQPRTAYRYSGESEWCRLGAIDKADNVVRLCRGVPHASILDVGAGEGSILSRLAELGFGETYTAIEVSETAVEAVRGRGLPNLVECRLFDGESIPYGDGLFDLAILSHVIEHVENPRKLLYEARRVARRVFVEVPLEHNLRLPRDFVADDLGHINAYTPRTLRRLVQSCGLEVLAQIVTNRSRATYEYHGDRLGGLKYWIKELALRAAPGLATSLWTYHGSLLCGPARARAA